MPLRGSSQTGCPQTIQVIETAGFNRRASIVVLVLEEMKQIELREREAGALCKRRIRRKVFVRPAEDVSSRARVERARSGVVTACPLRRKLLCARVSRRASMSSTRPTASVRSRRSRSRKSPVSSLSSSWSRFAKDKMTLRVPTAKAASVGLRKLADADARHQGADDAHRPRPRQAHHVVAPRPGIRSEDQLGRSRRHRRGRARSLSLRGAARAVLFRAPAL